MPSADDKPELTLDPALLSWIQQSAPYGVITLDNDLVVRGWNNWTETHSGLKLKAVLGKKLFELFPDLTKRKLTGRFERALLGESSVLSTALHGYLLPFPSPLPQAGYPFMRQTARITPLLSGKNVCGIVLVIEDVTQRESQSEDLRWQHRRDEMLSWALGHMLKSEEPRNSIRQLFFKIAEYLELDTFLLYLNDESGNRLRLHTVGGIAAEQEKDFAECPFPIDQAVESPTVYNSIQGRTEPEFATLKKARVTAAVALPLFANKRAVGFICFASSHREFIGVEESELLKLIAQHLATAIDREDTSQQLQKAKEQLFDYSQLLEKRVAERTSRLQESVSELETLSYTLAHDLKAPLRGMTGYCHILLTDFTEQLPPDGKLIARRLLRNSQRMEGLIRDLLAFSHVSQDEIQLTPVDILPLLNDLLSLRIPAVREAVTIKTPLLAVRAHKALLQQVLSNLVDNAVKFVESETLPKITILNEEVLHSSPSTRTVPLMFSSVEPPATSSQTELIAAKHKRIRTWIIDEGIGIASEAHQKIFGVFERGGSGSKYDGNGMGLAIVARAIQRMGGTCGVESELGKGSRFWIELPAG